MAKFPHLEHPSQCRQYMTDRIDLAESVGTLNGSERIHERKEVSLAVAKSATSPCRALHCVCLILSHFILSKLSCSV